MNDKHTDLTVTVRYPGYVRKAIIRQSRSCCRWYVVKWLDEPNPVKRKKIRRTIKKVACQICGRLIGNIAPNVEEHRQKHVRLGEV